MKPTVSTLAILTTTLMTGLGIGHFWTGSGGPTTAIASTSPGQMQVGFSPDGNAETIVLGVIQSARATLRVAAYSFTSVPVTRALVDAKKRGVDVQVVVDAKSNEKQPSSRAALSTLTNAGIPVRLNDRYAIHHDKFIISDGKTVETGSFNYSASAARRNSENALAIWNNPNLAQVYNGHWNSRFNEARPFVIGY